LQKTALILFLTLALCPLSQAAEPAAPCAPAPLIVVGFMGGRISANNLAHREALLTEDLRQRYPASIHALLFANRDGSIALQSVLHLIDPKTPARIVLFGHSWGASEAINLARQLNQQHIPVLLTIQVDSVEKLAEDDQTIPPNVHEAINFYQTEGLLHGRRLIRATDPAHTTILGNFESTYKASPVSLTGYPWFARTFMKSHIEIENDPAVWTRVEALIVARSCSPANLLAGK